MKKWLKIEKERLKDKTITITIPYIQYLKEQIRLIEIGDIKLEKEVKNENK